MESPELLNERELATKLKCSVPAIRLWRSQGMPFRRLGKRLVRFEYERVLSWFQQRSEQTQQATPKPITREEVQAKGGETHAL